MNIKSVVLLLLIGMFFMESSVYGYIDPGTGSFIIQILIAGFLGGLYAVKFYWKKIKGGISSVFK